VRFGASAVLVESTIADCATRDSRGGGAYVDQANLTLQGGSRVERCLADYGGGLMALEADVALLEGSILSKCHATDIGGGLRARLVAHVERASRGRRHASWEGTGPPEYIELARLADAHLKPCSLPLALNYCAAQTTVLFGETRGDG
jgi:hypothetical protein